jgi:hypothetical protein
MIVFAVFYIQLEFSRRKMLHHRISKIVEGAGRCVTMCQKRKRKLGCSDEPGVEPSEETGKEYIIPFEEGGSLVMNYVNNYVIAFFVYYFHIIACFCRNVILIFL